MCAHNNKNFQKGEEREKSRGQQSFSMGKSWLGGKSPFHRLPVLLKAKWGQEEKNKQRVHHGSAVRICNPP